MWTSENRLINQAQWPILNLNRAVTLNSMPNHTINSLNLNLILLILSHKTNFLNNSNDPLPHKSSTLLANLMHSLVTTILLNFINLPLMNLFLTFRRIWRTAKLVLVKVINKAIEIKAVLVEMFFLTIIDLMVTLFILKLRGIPLQFLISHHSKVSIKLMTHFILLLRGKSMTPIFSLQINHQSILIKQTTLRMEFLIYILR